MILFNYALSLSLILLSVVKTADLFIASDKALTRTESLFIKKTQNLHKNEKGSLSLTAAVFTALLCLLCLFYLTKMKLEYKEALYRKESYLCFHYLNTETKKYIKEMSLFNWSLRTAFTAKNTVVNGISGEAIFKAMTLARNARHYLYLKKMAANKFCKIPETLSYLKNAPFKLQSTGGLETNIDETTKVRENKWSYLFYKNPIGIRWQKSFCLKTNFHIQNSFIPETKYESEEITIKDLSNLKCFSGSSS